MARRVRRRAEPTELGKRAEQPVGDAAAARWARDPPAAENALRRADGGTRTSALTSMQTTTGNASVQRLFGFGSDDEEVDEVGASGGGPIEEAPTETIDREQPSIEGSQGGGASPGREQVGGGGFAEEELIGQEAGEQTEGGAASAGEEQVNGEGTTEGESIEGVSEDEATPAAETTSAPADLADRVHAAGEGFGTDEAALFGALRTLGHSAGSIAALKATFFSRFGIPLEEFLRDELSGPELEEALFLISPRAA